ncbi:MAG: hypothetical protein ABIC91_07455 [Nanoarchaeota archaeon]|nr:hypothetical protein [Nanoarchaeota archaeon]MBU1030725.1 hypothetical protein [Nanoarchaeota archaeon]MBU1849192.1 hypothetical protein [Nanoarchaeota archaeon]
MIHEVKRGCPLCKSNVKGDAEHKYYCKKCNILFAEEDLRKPTPKKVLPTNVIREKGYLYFVDKEGDISRVKRATSRADKGPKLHEKVLKVGVKKEPEYLYYVNKNGKIGRSKMARGGKK